MATNSPTPSPTPSPSSSSTVPEAHIKVPDEPKSSSNGGINIALILTVVLAIACVIGALLAVPKWTFDGDSTRPENVRRNSGLPDPNTLPPGTTGAYRPNQGPAETDDKSFVNGQAVQGDTITRGPGAPPAQPAKTSSQAGQNERGGFTSNSGTHE